MSISFKFSLTTLLAAPLVFAAAGCSESDKSAAFAYSESTLSLMPEAQNGVAAVDEEGNPVTTEDGETVMLPGVKELIDSRFGTPQDLVAWKALPINFGGTEARIAEDGDADSLIKELTLELDEDSLVELEAGDQIQFVTGDGASGDQPQTVTVAGWDSETGVVQLTSELAEGTVPKAGDKVVINGGQHLANGRALYMRHCSHCHGTTGDGMGPTAEYLYPRPRNYRHGVFKFTSTTDADKASRDDIKRILKYGIPGTYMPSFLLLEDEELDQLVEYVRFLAMRGEFERKLAALLAGDFSQEEVASRIEDGESRSEIVAELQEVMSGYFLEDLADETELLIEKWTIADDPEAEIEPSIPRVPDSPESRRRGRELYLGKTLNCADCHGAYGLGNGPQTIAFEKNPVTQELYDEPGLHDVWDNLNQPRNLTQGIYRGGRRPIDLFRRIHAGIKGSRMPSFKNTPHEDIWHVVNYVLSIPFEVEPGVTGATASNDEQQSGESDAAAD